MRFATHARCQTMKSFVGHRPILFQIDLNSGVEQLYRLILVDADDTLFDFEKAEKAAFEQSFMEIEHDLDVEEMKQKYTIINKLLWNDVEKGLLSSKQVRVERFRRLFQDLDMKFSADQFSDLFIKHLSEGTFLLDGAEEMCKYLNSKYTVVIVTNGIKEVQLSRLERSSIKKYISEIIISEEIGVNKPDSRIFEFALKKLNHSDKSNVLMIGDSLSSDIQGGFNFGIDTCWLNPKNSENTTALKPTYHIQRIDQLYKIL
jgi:2-haloacid dehalogenase